MEMDAASLVPKLKLTRRSSMRSRQPYGPLALTLTTLMLCSALAAGPAYARNTSSVSTVTLDANPGAITLTPFNPALGTLSSVDLSLTAAPTAQQAELEFFDTATHPDDLGSTVVQSLNLLRPDNTPLLTLFQTTFVTINLPAQTPVFLTPTFDPASAGPITLTDAADLALFTGMQPLTLLTNGSVAGTGPPEVIISPIMMGNGGLISQVNAVTLSATYTYTPLGTVVPEPGALTLLAGMGLSGVAFALRRRRGRASAASKTGPIKVCKAR
jgi:hypothetical protein